MKDFDNIVKGAIGSAIVGLGIWVFTMNADIKVMQSEIDHVKADQREAVEVMRSLTKAVTDLRVVIESLKPKK